MNKLKKAVYYIVKRSYNVKTNMERIGQVFIMIKRILTLRVVFDNILGSQKYKRRQRYLKKVYAFWESASCKAIDEYDQMFKKITY